MTEEEWVKMIGGAFAYMDAPFAVHPRDAERARDYRAEARAHGLAWSDIERHLTLYMEKKSFAADAKAKSMKLARKFFKSFS